MMAFARFRILALLAVTAALGLFAHTADAQVYNRFGPANGILKGDTSTYITTSALSADVISLWTGTCNASSFLKGDGSCAVPAGTGVTSVGLTMPSGFSVGGSPVTTAGTLAVTTTLNGLIHGNGSGFTAGTAAVADGGTGAVTLSGVLKGNTTSPVTSAANTDVISLWTGTCNNTTFLRGDGTCAAGAGGSTANPTAVIGLTAVNGVAASSIRSDGAPALSQAIAPTWTAQHIFGLSTSATATPAASLQSNFPVFEWSELDGTTNNKNWQESANGEQMLFRVVNDARNTASDWMTVDRTATTIDAVSFPATAQVTVGTGPFNLSALGNSTNAFVITGVPRFYINETAASANNRLWRQFAGSGRMSFTAANDAVSAETEYMGVGRSGTTITSVQFLAGGMIVAGSDSGSQDYSSGSGITLGVNPLGGAGQIRVLCASCSSTNKVWGIGQSGAGSSLAINALGDTGGMNTGLAAMVIERSGTTPTRFQFPITTPTTSGAFQFGAAESQAGATVVLANNTAATGYGLQVASTDVTRTSKFWNRATTGDNNFIYFATETTQTDRGSIDYNRAGGVTRYNTTSDKRLKTAIADAGSASSIIDAIKVRQFDWREPGHDHVKYGFVAQELAQVAPEAVSQGDAGETIVKTWGVDPSKLVPAMVKELQELRKRVADLEAAQTLH